MNSLLFSLPGTPVIYYGDEIGMGDNIYLGDRNGVRTPMQWTGDRNGGFSRADAARLYAPLITDPVYGFAAVNVEAQERAPFSLLNWMKRLIGLRKQHRVFGRGAIEFVPSPNRKVLAYVRRDETDTILCVANLSRSVQPVELDLSRFRGMVPVEMFGQTEFPRIGDQPYFLSLGAYAFNWFRLQPVAPSTAERTTPETAGAVPEPPALFVGSVWDTLLDGTVRTLIERDLLCNFLHRQPWFQGARPRAARFKDWGLLHRGPEPMFLTIVEAEIEDVSEGSGTALRQYLRAACPRVGGARDRGPGAVPARGRRADDRRAQGRDLRRVARHALRRSPARSAATGITTRQGRFHYHFHRQMALKSGVDGSDRREPPAAAMASGVDSAAVTLKLFRRVEPGVHPEIEITGHLTDAGFTRVPLVAAVVDYVQAGGESSSIGMFTRPRQPVESQADGWTHAMEWLSRLFDQVAAVASSDGVRWSLTAAMGRRQRPSAPCEHVP